MFQSYFNHISVVLLIFTYFVVILNTDFIFNPLHNTCLSIALVHIYYKLSHEVYQTTYQRKTTLTKIKKGGNIFYFPKIGNYLYSHADSTV